MLSRLAEIIGSLPWSIIENNTIFLELDGITFKDFTEEVESHVEAYSIAKVNVPDIGTGIRLNYLGRNVIVACSNKEIKLDTMYVAFKTKV